MDTLSHGLWGGIAFYGTSRNKFTAGICFGLAPDLLSFGLFHFTHPTWFLQRLAGEVSGPPPIAILPEIVFHAYNLTHSLVVWSILFAVAWSLLKNPPWPFLAWGLHILFDIPTHNSGYFPTPYLWPFPTPFVEGVSWATPVFLLANYGTLLVMYTVAWFIMRQRRLR